MGQLEKDLLYQAANSELGIECESEDVDKDAMRLAQERQKSRDFKQLTIRRAKAEGKIWIVRLPAEEEKNGNLADLDLGDLEID